MPEERIRENIDLCFYRTERARQDLMFAKNNFSLEDYRVANNRAYYSIFHSMRAVLALDAFDSKKHSGVISAFRKNYLKTGILPKEISGMIDLAFEVRNASDYNDMFLVSKEQTMNQIKNAEFILEEVKEYIGASVSSYIELFNEEGNDNNSQILNLLLASLFSSDTLITIYDCNRAERELLKIKWAIDESELSDEMKKHWKEHTLRGIEICHRDRAEMESLS